MAWVVLTAATGSAAAGEPSRSSASTGEPRPAPSALRLGEADLLARFTPEVRRTPLLRDRALALWRMHFEPSARQLLERLDTEEDWRPVLADAAILIDEFLEASLLPRVGSWPVEGAEEEKVWVEKLDRRTGLRVRVQRPVRRPVDLFSPKER